MFSFLNHLLLFWLSLYFSNVSTDHSLLSWINCNVLFLRRKTFRSKLDLFEKDVIIFWYRSSSLNGNKEITKLILDRLIVDYCDYEQSIICFEHLSNDIIESTESVGKKSPGNKSIHILTLDWMAMAFRNWHWSCDRLPERGGVFYFYWYSMWTNCVKTTSSKSRLVYQTRDKYQ